MSSAKPEDRQTIELWTREDEGDFLIINRDMTTFHLDEEGQPVGQSPLTTVCGLLVVAAMTAGLLARTSPSSSPFVIRCLRCAAQYAAKQGPRTLGWWHRNVGWAAESTEPATAVGRLTDIARRLVLPSQTPSNIDGRTVPVHCPAPAQSSEARTFAAIAYIVLSVTAQLPEMYEFFDEIAGTKGVALEVRKVARNLAGGRILSAERLKKLQEVANRLDPVLVQDDAGKAQAHSGSCPGEASPGTQMPTAPDSCTVVAGGNECGDVGVDCYSLMHKGKGWRLRFRMEEETFPGLKGLGDIAALLAEPGTTISAWTLSGRRDSPPATQQTVDQETIDRIRREIEDAEEVGNTEKAEELGAQLLKDLNKSGQPRPLNDERERARKSVHKRIKHAIAKIAEAMPESAAHWDECLRLGNSCQYDPPDDVQWTVG
ncbi:hypothetical protein ACFL59_03030 [Planctomycetota bacterium]